MIGKIILNLHIIIVIILLFIGCNSSNEVKYSIQKYELGDQKFDWIYLLKRIYIKQQQQKEQQILFLKISCRQQKILSISLTPILNFTESPRFNIQRQSQKSKVNQKMYTFMENCPIYKMELMKLDNIISIFNQDNDIIFAIKNDIHYQNDHVKVTIIDQSIKWGLGQRFQSSFHINDGSWTIWNRDKPWKIDRGSQFRSQQTYGHHPIYLGYQQKSKRFHICWLKNTFGMKFKSSKKSHMITYHMQGGFAEFILIGNDNNPQRLLQRYHRFIGRSNIPPFWSMGWHQSRWGYKNIEQFTQIIKKYKQNFLPLDTMWSDLDYMKDKAIFTINQKNYPSKKMRKLLIEQQIHFIPLIDAGVSLNEKQSTNKGIEMNVFFKSIHNKGLYTGKVWPGQVHFVDFLHPNATSYWQQSLDRLYNQIPFSGVWLDMNQPSNFAGNQPIYEKYRIQGQQSINMMTIDSKLQHYNCQSIYYCEQNINKKLFHQEVHAYYGHLTTIPTYSFLEKKNNRSFIISRSNSISSGIYAGHWTGDNNAQWQFLRLSINGNFLFQIFGIHIVGADICGFHKDTNQQLCSRWMQLGSLYPFARNHNQIQSRSQQPFSFGQILLQTSKLSLNLRYSLLKQLYTTLVVMNGTGSFFRPLIFEFPTDQKCFEKQIIQTQFLLGQYLMSAPIVYQNIYYRNIYFPKDNNWYEIENEGNGKFKKIGSYIQGGISKEIKNNLPSAPPIFLRNGYCILTNAPKMRTKDLNNKFYLTGALKDKVCKGKILNIANYSDQTSLKQCIFKGCSLQFTITLQNQGKANFQWKEQSIHKLDIKRMNLQIMGIILWQNNFQWKFDQVISTQKLQSASIDLNIKKTLIQ